uniref:Uncharacterized protein n=1 Tax=Mycena chlorophos TaxID=658473 RepID=A0ABQ0L9I4_MYCCL|nr:predicted protein [Mycena chlorophos]
MRVPYPGVGKVLGVGQEQLWRPIDYNSDERRADASRISSSRPVNQLHAYRSIPSRIHTDPYLHRLRLVSDNSMAGKDLKGDATSLAGTLRELTSRSMALAVIPTRPIPSRTPFQPDIVETIVIALDCAVFATTNTTSSPPSLCWGSDSPSPRANISRRSRTP